MQSYTVGFGAFATVCVCLRWIQVAKATTLNLGELYLITILIIMYFSGQNKIQKQLQGFFKKIKSQEIRNKVAIWQKYLASASSRLRFDSFSSADDSEPGPSSVNENNETIDIVEIDDENVVSNDVCTPSDSGTCIFVASKSDQMEEIIIVSISYFVSFKYISVKHNINIHCLHERK